MTPFGYRSKDVDIMLSHAACDAIDPVAEGGLPDTHGQASERLTFLL